MRYCACRVVLATGQGGGAWTVPAMVVRALPPHTYAHSNGPIEFGQFAEKHIGILGHGGSAFDVALTALREGAARVNICFRRPLLPWSTRTVGSDFQPFSRITRNSATASAGTSPGISTSTTRRRATPSSAHAGSPDSAFTPTASGRVSIGQAM